MPSPQYDTRKLKDPQFFLYDKYNLDNEYSYDSGTLVLPCAGPDGSPPRIVKTHASIGFRKCTLDSQKTGAPPWFPRIGVNTEAGDIFLGASLSIPIPAITTGQTGYRYSVRGEINYVQPGEPRGADDVFETGEYPFETPLIAFWGALKVPAFTGLPGFETPIEPNWLNSQYQWLSTSVPGFFMYSGLIG